jgi:hypothetical protein
MTDLIIVQTAGPDAPAVEEGEPDPAKLISGEHHTKTWNHYTGEHERLYCGIWESSPGKIAIDYQEWEFCHVIEGAAVLTNDAGRSWTLRAGDAFIIPPGFKGTWETVERVRKHYVILLPKSAN